MMSPVLQAPLHLLRLCSLSLLGALGAELGVQLEVTSVSMKTTSYGRESRTSLGSFPRDTRPHPCPSLFWISILSLPAECTLIQHISTELCMHT